MATMATIDVDDDMFECAICLEQINDTWRMLPCQHTFCLMCLEKLNTEDEQLQCPTCRKMVMVSIDFLEKPRLLLALFEKFEANRKKVTENNLISLQPNSFSSQDGICSSANVKNLCNDDSNNNHSCSDDSDNKFNHPPESFHSTKLDIIHKENQNGEPAFVSAKNVLSNFGALDHDIIHNENQNREPVFVTANNVLSNFGALDESSKNDSGDNIIHLPANFHNTELDIMHNENQNGEPAFVSAKNVLSNFGALDHDIIHNENQNREPAFVSANNVLSNFGALDDSSNNDSGDHLPASSHSTELNVTIHTENPESSEPIPANRVVSDFGGLDLESYLKKPCDKLVLNTIIRDSQENLLTKNKILEYLEIIGDHLDALDNHERDQMNKLLEDHVENRESSYRRDRTTSQQNEEAIMNIVLKKSEILDRIHSFKSHLLDAKEKLEFKLAIIESEEYHHIVKIFNSLDTGS